MRQATFRQPHQRDWGLPAFTSADVWRDLRDTGRQAAHHLLTHRREARRLRRYLADRSGPVLLSIGSGRTVPAGWIGIDLKHGDRVFRCDLRKPLPLPDASVDGVLAEHVLEHFCLDDLPTMLTELLRVLRPNAPLRVVSPDAGIVAALLDGRDDPRVQAQIGFDTRVHGWDPGEPLLRWRIANRLAYQFGQHQVLLTAATTTALLHAAGFIAATSMAMTETAYFDTVPGTHLARFPDSAHEAFTVEAIRPGTTAAGRTAVGGRQPATA
ncbi:class I SAM-dependent methyltransferase [Micromonosporaceae bacterium Da 78-11]